MSFTLCFCDFAIKRDLEVKKRNKNTVHRKRRASTKDKRNIYQATFPLLSIDLVNCSIVKPL